MASAPAAAATPASAAPPHNIEAEESVLGAILLADRTMYGLVIEDGLRPEHFYREQHRVIFAAMLELYDGSQEIDDVTLSEHLRETGRLEEAGGRGGVASLAAAVPAPAHARHYAKIVRDNALLRDLLTTTYEIQVKVAGRQASPQDLVEQAERAVLEVAHDDRRQDFRSVHDVLDVELDKLHRLSTEKTALTGTPSGFKDLDELTGGFQPGNLIVLAARPSLGKSALVTNMAENAALEHGYAVALFSLEMSEAELAQRFIASQARVPGESLRKGRAEKSWPKIVKAANRLAQGQIWIDDSSDQGILDIRAKARRLHHQAQGKGLGLIIVDYLQLMRADTRTENRAEQVAHMSRGLKILARELDVPVIALSQLNRSLEARTDKRPMLADLRESGAIEQDADVVVFIYRDEIYNEDSEHEGEAELIVAKHRNGPLGKVTLTFQKEYPKFMNFAGERFAA